MITRIDANRLIHEFFRKHCLPAASAVLLAYWLLHRVLCRFDVDTLGFESSLLARSCKGCPVR